MLENWQLLSILFQTGTKTESVEFISKKILAEFGSLTEIFYSPVSKLKNLNGIGKAKLAILLSVKELVERIRFENLKQKKINLNSIFQYIYLKTKNEVRENFFTASFNSENELINLELIAKGSLGEVGIYSRDVVKIALDDGATSFLVIHNHPKEKSEASSHDYHVYNKLKSLFNEMNIELIDHYVVGIDGIFSCKLHRRISKRELI